MKIFTVLIICLYTVALPHVVYGSDYCSNYAESATEQYQKSLSYQCSYQGLRWSNDKSGHKKWCNSVRENIAKKEEVARKKLLNKCIIGTENRDSPDLIELKEPRFRICVTKNLKDYLYGDVKNPEKFYTKEKLSSIEELKCQFLPIMDFKSLRYFTDLKRFIQYDTPAQSDVTGVGYFENLESFKARGTNIYDVKPLSNLKRLKVLNLYACSVRDISSFNKLLNIESLKLPINNIENVESLGNLKNLRVLSLFGNEIVDITPLRNLTNLEDLNLGSNKITDISALKGLRKLKKLSISSNMISNISVLSKLSSLESLEISVRYINNLKPLINLKNLRNIDIYDSPGSAYTREEVIKLVSKDERTYKGTKGSTKEFVEGVIKKINSEN